MLTEASREKGVEVAERIRKSFAQMAQDMDRHPDCATVSIGLVHCQERALDIPNLLTQADHSLYWANERGRNRVEVATLNRMIERMEQERTLSASSVGASSVKSAAEPASGIFCNAENIHGCTAARCGAALIPIDQWLRISPV